MALEILHDDLTDPYDRFQTVEEQEQEQEQEHVYESSQDEMDVYKEFRKGLIDATEHFLKELTKRGFFPSICKDEFRLDLRDNLDNHCYEILNELQKNGAE